LISHTYGTDLELSKKISNPGNIKENMPKAVPGNILKPNFIIRDFNAKSAVSDNSQYYLMYTFSYVIENKGLNEGQIVTNVYTTDATDLENIKFSFDANFKGAYVIWSDSILGDILLSISLLPGDSFTVKGNDYIKKSYRWTPGVVDNFCANVTSGAKILDEKCVKVTLP
jgi:hypothetical protein